MPPRASAWRWTACLYGAGNHVAIRQLVEDFGRYLYLPRLQTTAVLLNAIALGLALLTWEQDAFAYAESYDESAGRYRGLRYSMNIDIRENDPGLLISPDVARRQINAEIEPPVPPRTGYRQTIAHSWRENGDRILLTPRRNHRNRNAITEL